ncbi:hypothetical protein PTSG_09712 [Salpingoeca rosetta]|uniref:CRAL/TRIO N-terminal domain-containing protein n=1 Tax=Salpingoeca rosetta (strain ATCC 50818 / BSB-021) TaxID=946362 RepID=F2UNU1_SALR5|nr:uncharacterized protein PTSG_09712 [Salpingoeca rosetta]EGD79296.1 hypothetical protein PTSG_09712 [Salpingoeca rosetta]|eukprot:XP_004989067.1 hypothetical protein PTSG_09712 [Salpingoeca rosetta]
MDWASEDAHLRERLTALVQLRERMGVSPLPKEVVQALEERGRRAEQQQEQQQQEQQQQEGQQQPSQQAGVAGAVGRQGRAPDDEEGGLEADEANKLTKALCDQVACALREPPQISTKGDMDMTLLRQHEDVQYIHGCSCPESMAHMLRFSTSDNYDLARFLRARNYDVDKAEAMLRGFLKWREEEHVRTCLLRPDPIELLWQCHSPADHYGHDRIGRPIVIERIGVVRLHKLLRLIEREDFMTRHSRLMEMVMASVRCARRKYGAHVTQHVVIMDLKDLSFRPHPASIPLFRQSIDMDQLPEEYGGTSTRPFPRQQPLPSDWTPPPLEERRHPHVPADEEEQREEDDADGLGATRARDDGPGAGEGNETQHMQAEAEASVDNGSSKRSNSNIGTRIATHCGHCGVGRDNGGCDCDTVNKGKVRKVSTADRNPDSAFNYNHADNGCEHNDDNNGTDEEADVQQHTRVLQLLQRLATTPIDMEHTHV